MFVFLFLVGGSLLAGGTAITKNDVMAIPLMGFFFLLGPMLGIAWVADQVQPTVYSGTGGLLLIHICIVVLVPIVAFTAVTACYAVGDRYNQDFLESLGLTVALVLALGVILLGITSHVVAGQGRPIDMAAGRYDIIPYAPWTQLALFALDPLGVVACALAVRYIPFFKKW